MRRPNNAFAIGLALALTALACDGFPSGPELSSQSGRFEPQATANSRGHARGNSNVVEVVATGLHFNAPNSIPSGWTTFRFRNRTGRTHFVILEKMPCVDGGAGACDQKTVEDSKAEVVPVFQAGLELIAAGKINEALAEFGTLPDWYFSVVFTGGPGLIAPGRTAETTVNLTPGTYVIECYVKSDGRFHSADGMIDEIVVTDETSRAREPRSTLRVTVSSTGGIDVRGHLRPGRHTVAVHFDDQTGYSHFLGHDVHLARIEPGTDLDALAAWMNWSVPGELETPVPAGVEFLGGVQDMPGGSTGYFEVLLKPGTYAWIAEVPDPNAEASVPEHGDMLQTFTVP